MTVLPDMKPIAEALLARGGPAGVARALGSGRRWILAYHNVLPSGSSPGGDTSLHLPRERFSGHLDVLEDMARVVPLEELVFGAPSSNGTGIRVALTFDDGYRGALTHGLDELEARGLPATFFVAPGLVGDHSFWWDEVSMPEGGPLTGLAREVALEVCRGRGDEVRAWARRRGLGIREPEPDFRTVTEEELDRVASRPGVSLGSHGWSHANLAAVDPEERDRELRRSKEWLEERYPISSVLSYPYGRWTPELCRAAKKAGYRAGLRVDGGGLQSDDPLRAPRLNVPSGLSPDGLRLRLSGVLA